MSILRDNGSDIINKEKVEKMVKEAICKDNDNNEKKYQAVREFREDFKDLIEASKGSRVIVLIDDLDRCLPRHIIDSLEAIKLFLNVPHTAFVIAADEYIVSNAIKSEYKDLIDAAKENDKDDDKRNHHQDIGTSYMEKFIQLPYRLPVLSRKEVETFITLLFCQSELSENDFAKIHSGFIEFSSKNKFEKYGWENIEGFIPQSEKTRLEIIIGFVSHFSNIISNTLRGNPRLIKRFLNAYEMRSNLLKVSNMGSQNNRFVLLKLMLLEYKYPELFKQLHGWTFASKGGIPEEIVNCEKCAAGEESVTKQEEAEGAWSNDDVKNLLNSEPKFSSVDLRELYWVSRDNLKDAMGGDSMIPLRVKKIFSNILAADSLPMKNKYMTDVQSLNGEDLTSFYDLLDSQILSNPKEESGYSVYVCCIQHDIESAYPKFLTILKRINVQDIPFPLGNQFKDIYNQKNDQQLVEIISKNKALKTTFDTIN